MTTTLKIVKPQTTPQKSTRTTVDTICITPDLVRSWEKPPFQRELRVNSKVTDLAAEIRNDGGVIPGVITIGVIGKQRYLLDGQHRREAFLLSECEEGFVDVRIHHFTDMADMGEEFVKLNSQLVRMRPDDILRGLEASSEGMAYVREHCPFVGYDNVRRSGGNAPVISMSALLRAWMGSVGDIPSPNPGSAAALAKSFQLTDAKVLAGFLSVAFDAWGRDPEYFRLWGSLNLQLCAWLYRRIHLSAYSPKTVKLTRDQFKRCLMALSSDSNYVDWLIGRNTTERDRSPAYRRIKSLFAKRIEEETGKRPLLPMPPWAAH